MSLKSTIREKAAIMLAEDRYPDEKIAEVCGISRRTLDRWKNNQVFAAKVEAVSKRYADRALKHGLARIERRIQVLSDVHERILQVIDARAEDKSLSTVPGGATGLLVHDVKGVGKGNDFRLVNIYTADVSLLRELRAIEEQIAKELGQWTEKREVAGVGGEPLIPEPKLDLSKLSIEELKFLRNLTAKAAPESTMNRSKLSDMDLSKLSDEELEKLEGLYTKA